MKAGAPDNIRDVEYAAVLEYQPSILYRGSPWDALDARRVKVSWLHSNQRTAHREYLPAKRAPHRRIHREHAMEEAPEHEPDQHETSRKAVNAEGDVADVPASEPLAVRGSSCWLPKWDGFELLSVLGGPDELFLRIVGTFAPLTN